MSDSEMMEYPDKASTCRGVSSTAVICEESACVNKSMPDFLQRRLAEAKTERERTELAHGLKTANSLQNLTTDELRVITGN
jgi:hypothetical protein